MAVTFLLFSNWYENLGELEVLGASHSQEINSTDQLSLTVTQPLAKGDRVLWNDEGVWREHVVSEPSQTHDGGETFEAVCVSSLQYDLKRKQTRLFVVSEGSAREALEAILEGTAWEVGEVGDFGAASIAYECEDRYECVMDTAGCWGGEVLKEIEVGRFGVASRKVSLLPRIGGESAVRFEYGHGMTGVTKRVGSEDVYTACYGYGKTLDTETDGVKDRLWVFVEGTEEQKLRWGQPDGNGGVMHSEGRFEDSRIDDEGELRESTRAYLAEHSAPSVSYETSVEFPVLNGVRLGDTLQVVDWDFTPELRLEARVGSIDRDVLSGSSSSVEFGNVVSVLPDVLVRAYTASAAALSAAASVAGVTVGSVSSAVDQKYRADGATMRKLVLDDGGSVGEFTVGADGSPYWNGKRIALEAQDA